VLNNIFSTSQRIDRLRKLQEAHSLPQLSTMCDVDVRVGSTCKVMKLSIVNYPTFRANFQTLDTPNVLSAISADEWFLIIEMKAITDYLARQALVEVQRDAMVSSYLPVYRRAALDKLAATHMCCFDLEGARHDRTNERTLERVKRSIDTFSDAGRTCTGRLKAQLEEIFPITDAATLVPLLCDPRT
jgi:hypothetical protein